MNYLTVTVGLAALGYSFYTLYIRIKAPYKYIKLIAMKKGLGNTPGALLHFFAYTMIPFIAGCSLIYRGWQGSSLFGP